MDPESSDDMMSAILQILAPVAGSRAEEEASLILDHVGLSRSERVGESARAVAERRAQGVPMGLLLGRQRFLGLELVTREAVIAPREETELLGREALAITRTLVSGSPEREVWIADVGCGSGNLACALAFHQPQAKVWASDLAEASVALTQENVGRHGLEAQVRTEQGDLLGPLRDLGLEGAMDLIVMNPPYIPSASLERDHAPLLLFEPREAFDGGPYGLTILCRMLREAPSFLRPGGHLLLEFGLGQARLVQTFAVRNNNYVDFRLAANAEGDARVAILRV